MCCFQSSRSMTVTDWSHRWRGEKKQQHLPCCVGLCCLFDSDQSPGTLLWQRHAVAVRRRLVCLHPPTHSSFEFITQRSATPSFQRSSRYKCHMTEHTSILYPLAWCNSVNKNKMPARLWMTYILLRSECVRVHRALFYTRFRESATERSCTFVQSMLPDAWWWHLPPF